MLKRFICAILCVIFCMILAACKSESANQNSEADVMVNQEKEESKTSIDQDSLNQPLSIYDLQGNQIGEFDFYAWSYIAGESFVYPRYDIDGENLEYFRYMLSEKREISLGSIADWETALVESVYIDEKLFFIVMTGNIDSVDDYYLKLMEMDFSENTIKEIYSQKAGSFYSRIAGFQNELYMCLIDGDYNLLLKYDLKSEEMSTVLKTKYNTNTQTGTAIYQVDGYQDEIAVLKMQQESSETAKLLLDVYDQNFNLLHSKDISGIVPTMSELRQPVKNFEYMGDCFLYENRSSSFFFGQVNQDQVINYMEKFGIENYSERFFRMAKEDRENEEFVLIYEELGNLLLLYDENAKSLKQVDFYLADESKYKIWNVYQNTEGSAFVHMNYIDYESTEDRPDQWVYVRTDSLG